MKRKHLTRWWALKQDALEFFEVVIPVVVALCVIGALIAALVMWGESAACQRVCRANGDESGWDWWAGCYCKDERGLYNPEDSRDTRDRSRKEGGS